MESLFAHSKKESVSILFLSSLVFTIFLQCYFYKVIFVFTCYFCLQWVRQDKSMQYLFLKGSDSVIFST